MTWLSIKNLKNLSYEEEDRDEPVAARLKRVLLIQIAFPDSGVDDSLVNEGREKGIAFKHFLRTIVGIPSKWIGIFSFLYDSIDHTWNNER